MNRITISGNLGKDPVVSRTKNGNTKLKFSMADNEVRFGEKVTTWHNCVMYGKYAEALQGILRKGLKVVIFGRQNHHEYSSKYKERDSFPEVEIFSLEIQDRKADGPPKSEAQRYAEQAADDEIPF